MSQSTTTDGNQRAMACANAGKPLTTEGLPPNQAQIAIETYKNLTEKKS